MLLVKEPIEEGYVNVFGEVQRLGCGGGGFNAARMLREDATGRSDPEGTLENITSEQVEELRRLTRPPAVVQHTLEACFLILHASSASLPLAHPQWARVQKKLADVDFLQELFKYDAGHLRKAPLLTSYIASEYFGIELPDGYLGRSSKNRSLSRLGDRKIAMEPLTFSRVHRASQAAAALFKWCAIVLERAVAMPPEAIEPLAEEERHVEVEPEAPVVSNVIDDCVDDQVVPVCPIEETVPEPSGLEDKAEAFRKKMLLRAWQKTCVSLRPDRHFEELAVFCAGRSKVDKDNSLALQNVAHAMRLRPSLQLQLMGCNDALEGEYASASRISSILRFFVQRDIPASVEGKGRTATISYPAGIVCKLLLNEERQLRDYFRAQEEFRKRSGFTPVSTLFSFIAMSFLESDAATLHSLVVASQGYRNAFEIQDSIFPLMTVSDVLFAMWLETNFQTFIYS